MRPFVLIAIPFLAAALSLAACGKDDQAESGRNAGAGLTADKIVANDITAIDAVTADAANMAADINYADALADLDNSSETNRATASPRPRSRSAPAPRPPARRSESAPSTPAETATNSE